MFEPMSIKCQWADEHGSHHNGEEMADYIEIIPDLESTKEGDNAPKKLKIDSGHLSNQRIGYWLAEDRKFSSALGGLRMIICERHRYVPLDFSLHKGTFDAIMGTFKLSPKTLQVFDCDAGAFSRSYVYGSGKLTGIDVVLKAPQRRDIPNYGLSMHHDLETCVTTALLYGADIQVCAADNKHPVPAPAIHTLLEKIQDENEATRFEKAEREFYSYFWTEEKHNECGRRPGLLSLIESSISTLQHPLALPCAILEDHMRATHESCEHGEVHAETWKIMNRLKMRGDDGNPRLFWIQAMGLNEFKPKGAEDTPKAGDPSFDPKTLTARIDRQILRIMFTERCPEWNRDCSLFILDLAKELNDRKPEQELFESDKHEILQGGLEQNMSISKALTCLLEVMKENLNLQLNVCASISAQVNNEYNLVTNENNLKLQKTTADLTETSTEIARHTSHDSTSMKILAVITALFLPGTFVASLLALNVFDGLWQEKGTGYSHLWIYFVIDIPLTLITMAGWARWWEFELHLRDNKKSYRDVWNALRKRKSPRRSESISLRRLDGSTQSGGSTEQLSHADSRAVAGPPLDLEQGREV